MKTLVLQLARLGDIYQSWPTLNALKRTNPNSEVHLLTRSAFATAAPSFVDRHWCLDTKQVLRSLVDEKPNVDQALSELSRLVEALKDEDFDRIINLSYSPFSASLVSELSRDSAVDVAGYTRHADRTLAIPDDSSAYFYAQVGAGKGNRLHVSDLFAHTAGVTLTEQDWEFGSGAETLQNVKEAGRGGIVVHLGASTLTKTLSWSKWLQIVKGLLSSTELPVVLVGSRDEVELAEKVSGIFGSRTPVNLVGRTNLSELFAIIDAAALVVGGDSAPLQIASLTDTPAFNLSFPIVSFWETGPRSAGSRILPLESEDCHTSDEIVREILATLRHQPATLPIVRVEGRMSPFSERTNEPQSFEWDLVKALYMGELFPTASSAHSGLLTLGVQRLDEVNALALEQIATIGKDASNQTASLILSRADDVMDQILRLVPETAPIVRWFRVERLRIRPGSVVDLVTATRSVHIRLGEVLSLYLEREEYDDVANLDKK